MRKLLFIVYAIALSLNLYASQNLKQDYQDALNTYKSKDYQSSYTLFSKLYLKAAWYQR